MIWNWPSDQRHTVQYHPSNTCEDVQGQVTIQPWSAGPGRYTFTEDDRTANLNDFMLFVCDIGNHCQDNGLQIRVVVLPILCSDLVTPDATEDEEEDEGGDAAPSSSTLCVNEPAEAPITVTRAPAPAPTLPPTPFPTQLPTRSPTLSPTATPIVPPTSPPPTASPTRFPTLAPTTASPTRLPTLAPVVAVTPTQSPQMMIFPVTTSSPTGSPTSAPLTTPPTAAPTTATISTAAPSPSTQSPIAVDSNVTFGDMLQGPVGGTEEERDVNVTAILDGDEDFLLDTTDSNATILDGDEEDDSNTDDNEEDENDDDKENDDDDEEEEEGPPPQQTQGLVTFSLVVVGGNRDSVPFDAYGPDLLQVVERLAESAIDEIDDLLARTPQERHLLDEDELKIDSLEILEVESLGFTSNPDFTGLGVFVGGACPMEAGNVQEDRCEEVSVSMQLLVGDGYDLDIIVEAFQEALNVAVGSGQLQFYMNQDFPDSRAKILSGQLLQDIITASTDQGATGPLGIQDSNLQASQDGFDPSTGIIAGIAVAIAVALAVVVAVLFMTRERRTIPSTVEADIGQDGKILGTSSPEGKTLPPSPSRSDDENEVHVIHLPTEMGDAYSYYSNDYDDDPHQESFDNYSLSASSVSTGTDLLTGNRVLVDLTGPMPDIPLGTDDFDALEAAVMAADWETLGARAASMANLQQQQSAGGDQRSNSGRTWDDYSRDFSARSNMWSTVIDRKKAEELHRYIEQGDWDAIIEAAKRYRAQTIHEEGPGEGSGHTSC